MSICIYIKKYICICVYTRQGQNLALTVLYVPYSLESGVGHLRGHVDGHRHRYHCRSVMLTWLSYMWLDCLMWDLTVLYVTWLSYMWFDCLICDLTVLYVPYSLDSGVGVQAFHTTARLAAASLRRTTARAFSRACGWASSPPPLSVSAHIYMYMYIYIYI